MAPPRCVALLSGGLDSMLAIRILQEQGVEVEALTFKTIFTCCQETAGQAARNLGVRLTVIGQEDDYLDLVRQPQFGYGKGANPCVDCRIYMFQRAASWIEQSDAQFVISGEVVGQRPMSQKRRDLNLIAAQSGLEDRLLRPLSAKLLPLTWPERRGLVDRERLYGFSGRSRKGLIELAERFGFQDIPSPSTGCALTEKLFSKKVHDLIQLDPDSHRWDFELLKTGRHFRFNTSTKVVVGRHETDNRMLSYMHERPKSRSKVLMAPENFAGPVALVIGPPEETTIRYTGGLLLRYGKDYDPDDARVLVVAGGETYVDRFTRCESADQAKTLATL